jgi:hypothetical protein
VDEDLNAGFGLDEAGFDRRVAIRARPVVAGDGLQVRVAEEGDEGEHEAPGIDTSVDAARTSACATLS